MEVLRIPALADVTVAITARLSRVRRGQALETDALPPDPHRGSFVSAVDRAERAWRAARDAAERIRLSGLSPAERGTVERVIKLLTTARDSDSDPERLAAYARARSELAKLDRAGVIHLPRTAQGRARRRDGRGALPRLTGPVIVVSVLSGHIWPVCTHTVITAAVMVRIATGGRHPVIRAFSGTPAGECRSRVLVAVWRCCWASCCPGVTNVALRHRSCCGAGR